MVLLSGSQAGKGGGQPQQQEEEEAGRDLPWGGSGDPLPQLLAAVSWPALEEEDYEELSDFSDLPDTRSIASDDSFYPPDVECWGAAGQQEGEKESSSEQSTPEPLSFFCACCSNNVVVLRALLCQGVTAQEACETDKNQRTGLLVACYQGYVDIVVALAQCPWIDINWQDSEGNTALITAAQAGHITITNYLLNYFPGLDMERRNVHGFTALMKAAMQGRTNCVGALMLAGADIYATDPSRGMTPRDWACFTGRHDTAFLMQKLMARPCPEQLSDRYKPEWPKLKELLAKAAEPKGCVERLSECVRSALTFNWYRDPEEDGALDHMVRMTTSLSSPFVAVSCKTLCPESPPCVGKRRFAVQEIIRRQRAREMQAQDKSHITSYEKLFQSSRITMIPTKKERRPSLQPGGVSLPQGANGAAARKSSLLPLHLMRRSSVRPGFVIPKVRLTKAPPPTYHPEKVKRGGSVKDSTHLQVPKWRYKEAKEERRKAEVEEKRKAEEVQKQKRSQGRFRQKRTFT
ncbi:ankyrin repeat domain-containing protein 33B [Rhinatrema bivittatum]|uniref:ankyrin repeat domain-containing protein 33B n=1 Tax=Rhinatrema bivittatum TaxID=194408 RepID=UPI001127C801|nr:ankyrin repeat domain-containing protein 33B [Rhinatrema bivittatum]